ncbi:MAG: gamma-glutamyltransferase [Lachnospiraceae bacterium]|nr:gamma-glutamyltransferase [Lachnospiraceae bacterium]
MKHYQRTAEGRRAVVSSARAEASQIGIKILEAGGNAVDAAVAVGFALGVCEPSTSGLGGGGFMLIKMASDPEPVFLDFRECAPMAATPALWQLDEAGHVLHEDNKYGGKAAGVPGEAAGLLYALEHYGTFPKEQVILPAAELAEQGFLVTPMMEEHFTMRAPAFERFRDGGSIYYQENRIMAGETCRNPKLGNTLRGLAEYGTRWFYEDEPARSILKCVRETGGVMTEKDLAIYAPRVRKPVRSSYRGYEILSAGLPSSGGTHILQSLNILEHFDVALLPVNSGAYLHLLSEVFKRVYRDRARYMADSDFVPVPVDGLTDKDYAAALAAQISMDHASPVTALDPWNYEHHDTTHYSIADADGNMVAVTKTINNFCGACLMPDDTGFILNDTMDDFSPDSESINCIAPGKKPLSSMSPTIVLRDGKPYAVLGSPGGERIINTVVQVISKLVDHGMSVEEAVASPRMTENTSDRIVYEGRMDPVEIRKAESLGHCTEKVLDFDVKMGGVQAVVYGEDGTIRGSADPRRDGETFAI